MRNSLKAFILASVLVPALALAEIYYWVDDRGIQNYTTRLESVPESYRSKVQALSVPTLPPAPEELRPSTSPGGPAKIPFTSGSPVMVSVRINGAGPVTLLLDTGSDCTLIRPSVLGKVGISTENARRAVLRGVTGVSTGDAVWVDSVEVGEARVGPLLIVVHDVDLKGADGLLGRDFLANFHVAIDSKEGIVTLTPN
jgi:predicted aspartyl protease